MCCGSLKVQETRWKGFRTQQRRWKWLGEVYLSSWKTFGCKSCIEILCYNTSNCSAKYVVWIWPTCFPASLWINLICTRCAINYVKPCDELRKDRWKSFFLSSATSIKGTIYIFHSGVNAIPSPWNIVTSLSQKEWLRT